MRGRLGLDDFSLFCFCTVRDGQIFRWPFQNARWTAARAKKDAYDREHDLAAHAPCRIIQDYSAQRDFQEATNCALFSSSFERKKPNASEQDQSPEQLWQHTLSRSGTALALPAHPPTLSWSDILDGCNEPLSSGSYCRRAAVDSHAPTLEFNEYSQHSSGSLSRSNRHSVCGVIPFAGTRDKLTKFSDGQLLEQLSEAQASSYLGACSTPEAISADLIEMGFTSCDLSYLVGR
jgi:hypothetical protein